MSCILIPIAHTHIQPKQHTHTDTDTHAHTDTYEYLVYIYCSQHNPLWRFYSPSSYTCWILQMDLFKIEPHEPRDSLSWSGLNHPNWRNLSFWLILSDPQLHAVFQLDPSTLLLPFFLKTLFDYLKHTHTQSWDNHDTWHLDISHIFSNHHTFSRVPPFPIFLGRSNPHLRGPMAFPSPVRSVSALRIERAPCLVQKHVKNH